MAHNNRRENASRTTHDYKVGDKVLLKKPGKHLRKLEAPRTGPHTVTAIYSNGTLRIQKGNVNERVKIRRLFPYFENADHSGSECTILRSVVVSNLIQWNAYSRDINIT
jgi:hypothetical protein